jgi:hypothetical protein
MSERAREPVFFEDTEEEPEPEPSTESAGRGGALTAVGSDLGDDESNGEPPAEGWGSSYDDPERKGRSLGGSLSSAIRLLFRVHSLPIEELNLSMRAAGVLRRSGLITLGQIMSKSEEELLALRNFGRKCYDELRSRLDELGLGPADAPWDSVRGVN